MTVESPFPQVEAAVVLIERAGLYLAVTIPKWQCFSLPMTRVKGRIAGGSRPETPADAAVPGRRQGNSAGLWRRPTSRGQPLDARRTCSAAAAATTRTKRHTPIASSTCRRRRPLPPSRPGLAHHLDEAATTS